MIAPFKINVKSNATVYDTISLIVDAINTQCNEQSVKRLRDELKPGQPGFIQRLYAWVVQNIEYERDPEGDERITLPRRTINEGFGDCKKYTVLIGSVLCAAGIRPLLKVISYNGTTWAHIYIIVPRGNSYITVDPVSEQDKANAFNHELSHARSMTINLNKQLVNLSLLGGPGFGRRSSLLGSLEYPLESLTMDMTAVAGAIPSKMQSNPGGRTAYRQFMIDANGTTYYFDGNTYKPTQQNYSKQLLNNPDNTIMRNTQTGQWIVRVPLTAKEYSLQCVQEDDVCHDYDSRMNGLSGFFQDVWDRIRNGAENVFDVFNPIVFAPGRGAFLLLVKWNALHLGDLMAQAWQKDKNKVIKAWQDLGGKPAELLQQINKGANTQLSGLGEVATTIAVTVATATPVLIAVIKLLKDMGIISPEQANDFEKTMNEGGDLGNLLLEIFRPDGNKLTFTPQAQKRYKRYWTGNRPDTDTDFSPNGSPTTQQASAGNGGLLAAALLAFSLLR